MIKLPFSDRIRIVSEIVISPAAKSPIVIFPAIPFMIHAESNFAFAEDRLNTIPVSVEEAPMIALLMFATSVVKFLNSPTLAITTLALI